MKVTNILVINVISMQLGREIYWRIQNQDMKVLSFLVINVISRQH